MSASQIALCTLECGGQGACMADCIYRAQHGGNDPPKPTNNLPTDADWQACQVEGMAYLGPNYLGYYTGEGIDKRDAEAKVTTWCRRGGEAETADMVHNSWRWLDDFGGTWNSLNTNQKTCTMNYLKTTNINWDRQVLDLIAAGCKQCDYWWKGGQCDHPITPINPIPPLVPLLPIPPEIEGLCPPGQPCIADLRPIVPLTPLHWDINQLTDLVPPANGPVVPITVSWWKEFEDEIIADLSELFISPEYLAMILAIDIPVIMTQDWKHSLLFTIIAFFGPLGMFTFRKIMYRVRVLIWEIKKTYAEFEQFEYPLLYAIISQTVVIAAIYGEKWFSIPTEIEGYSFLIGEGVVVIGAAIVWFLGTDYGKAVSGIGDAVFGFLDSLSSNN